VPLSRNLGTLTSWNPLGLSRPVMGLFCFFSLDCTGSNNNVMIINWQDVDYISRRLM